MSTTTTTRRRRPRLRVVGGDKRPPRHETMVEFTMPSGFKYSYAVEVVTWAEFDSGSRRDSAGGLLHGFCLPGLGFLSLRPAEDLSRLEIDDIEAACEAEKEDRAKLFE